MGFWNRMYGEFLDELHSWNCKHCGKDRLCVSRLIEETINTTEKSGICDDCWKEIEDNIKNGNVLQWVAEERISTAKLTHNNYEEYGEVKVVDFKLKWIPGFLPLSASDNIHATYLKLKFKALQIKPDVPVHLRYKGSKYTYESSGNNAVVNLKEC